MFERIEIDPKICNGKPVVRGTRIPVAVVLDALAAKLSSAHSEFTAFIQPFFSEFYAVRGVHVQESPAR